MGQISDMAGECLRRDSERKTLDLLDELAKALGHRNGINLGEVNDVLVSAIMAIKAKDLIVADLAEITKAEEGTPIASIIKGLREKLGYGETYRERLLEVNRDLAEITGMKHLGVTISDQVTGIKRAFDAIAPPAHPPGSSYAAIVLRCKDATPFEHGPTETPPRPFLDDTTTRLRKILDKTDQLREFVADTIAGRITTGGHF